MATIEQIAKQAIQDYKELYDGHLDEDAENILGGLIERACNEAVAMGTEAEDLALMQDVMGAG